MLTDLKPCPFCGGDPDFDHDDDGWSWIVCQRCGATTNASASLMDDCKPLLAERWNSRAIAAEVRAEAQEPVGVFADVNRRNDQPALWEQMVPSAYDGKEYIYLYAAPQPPAPCQKCAELTREVMRYQAAFSPSERLVLKLQAKAAELEKVAKAYEDQVAAHNKALDEVARLSALIEKCEKGLASVEWLIGDSQGVIGLHLNGDSAPWASLRTGGHFETWLIEFDEALAAIAAQKGGAA